MLKILRYTPKDSPITRGIVILDDIRLCDSMELPWKDNKKNVSCIPDGLYKYVPHTWSRNGMKLIRLVDVPDRTAILVHPCNSIKELKGCLGLGAVSKTGLVSSTAAVIKFIKEIPKEGELLISWV